MQGKSPVPGLSPDESFGKGRLLCLGDEPGQFPFLLLGWGPGGLRKVGTRLQNWLRCLQYD